MAEPAQAVIKMHPTPAEELFFCKRCHSLKKIYKPGRRFPPCVIISTLRLVPAWCWWKDIISFPIFQGNKEKASGYTAGPWAKLPDTSILPRQGASATRSHWWAEVSSPVCTLLLGGLQSWMMTSCWHVMMSPHTSAASWEQAGGTWGCSGSAAWRPPRSTSSITLLQLLVGKPTAGHGNASSWSKSWVAFLVHRKKEK